ncbi:nodulation protein NoeA-related protein (plasmid) [Gemmatirosa kalamazoonensis]|uniref:Nodulation protein NoeA-related protein n=1 Tax=Gemmatirosa kalamazoonensis TaxID=861299 RepID=W0RTD9_9BACT|nr:class I SAM-dependent methyltransferase [Gemmatirosa kalamazoonensis]AHG93590.1 nodulation protein NoeA-related protein [Gemmatirosa kalamazoonensis]
MTLQVVAGSFRDPSGFVYTKNGTLYRQVNRVFAEEYDAVRASGLYEELASAGLLVAHAEDDPAAAATPDAHVVLRPERVPFISYPYEWSFGQLKDAALLTLDVQRRALDRGFALRDASAYNVQFVDGRPILIDTLSIGRYTVGEPWIAYRQFCEHFLAPLALMAHTDVRCAALQRQYLNGIPLDLASKLLPTRTRFSPSMLLHIHLHARAQQKYQHADVKAETGGRRMTTAALRNFLTSLRDSVEGLKWEPAGTEWADYTTNTNYSDRAHDAKKARVAEFASRAGARVAWDLGANTGLFSRAVRDAGVPTVLSFDIDPAAVERNHRAIKASGERGITPFVLDLTNPSPAQGWAHEERMSLAERGPADLVLALALVHHLAISNNVPLERVAAYLAQLGRWVVIEFVPKSDSQVRRLLTNREDVFPGYTREGFEAAFAPHFTTAACVPVEESERWLYLLERR